MSVLHMVACGLIDVDDHTLDRKTFRLVRKAVQEELRPRGFRLGGEQGFYQLRKRIKRKGGGRNSYKLIFDGSFRNACKAATKIITPSDHEEI